jgi:hypothetical protein
MPALFLVSLLAGIVLLPVVWTEYFVLIVNFAVLVAGIFLFDLGSACLTADDGRLRRLRRWVMPLAIAASIIAIIDLVGRRLGHAHTLSLIGVTAVVALWFAIGSCLAFAVRLRSSQWPVLAVVLLLAFPLVEQLDYFGQASNEWQRARVDFVLANTRPDQCVFDGFSGYGVFRPHAYKYWFLHEEVQLMLSDKELGPDVIEALQRTRAPLVVCDQYSATLPAAVHRYIARNYRATEFPDIRLQTLRD